MVLAVIRDLGWAAGVLALAGAAYAVLAALLAGRAISGGAMSGRGAAAPASEKGPAVSILKPLYGAEPGLADNLETVLAQDYDGPVQFVFGVQDPDDPALAVVRELKAKYPDGDIVIVADPARHGANGKVSNLINMVPAARHPLLVISDSDIATPPDWLAGVVAALGAPGVGVVTCYYTGAPAPGRGWLWPRLAAMGTSYDFLPGVLLGVSLGLAQPCFGSTIALTRETLERIGGFAAFADRLADDYEIGRAVRGLGLTLAIPPLSVSHTAGEATPGALLRHELRWARTIRLINKPGHLGSVVTHGFVFALISAVFLGFAPITLWLIGLTLASRQFLKYRIDAIFGARSGPAWLLPVRDLVTFMVFALSLFGGTVHWRDKRFDLDESGTMTRP
jgi:ceramide glucosyltransferase